MRRPHLVPRPTLLLLLALLGTTSLVLPCGGRAFAGDDGKAPAKGAPKSGDGGGDLYGGATSFSADAVGGAIDRGIAWLEKKQGPDGDYGGTTGNATYAGGSAQGQVENPAGPTALAVYALLKCKVPLKNPAVKKSMEFLWKNHKEPGSSYETSMLLLAVCATADNTKMSSTYRKRKIKPKLKGRYSSWATKLAHQLVDKRTARGWRYNVAGHPETDVAGGPEDLSSTQLALLALFAAQRVGVRVDDKVWEDALSFTLDQQETDGPEVTYKDPVDPSRVRKAHARGFAYIKGREKPDEGKATGGMTACGIANLEMCRFVLSDGGEKRDAWNARPEAEKVQQAIYDGIAWIEKYWSPFNNPHKRSENVYHVYWLYALERAMDLLNLKLVGSHGWYSEMGQMLLNRQERDGHWDSHSTHGPRDTLDTCFALLFLKRATRGTIPHGAVTGGSNAPPADNR